MNYKCFSEIYKGESQFLREKMQYLFDKSFQESDEESLRKLYIALRQLQFNEGTCFKTVPIELTSLAETITITCDILSSASEVSFIFCGDEPCYIDGNERLISKALLNLLSNAYLYGKDKLITVKTVKKACCTRLEVLNGGSFSIINETGRGLTYVRKACEKMQGSFLIEQSISHTKAIMTFKNAKTDYNLCPVTQTDILSLVSDRLSPAYVEMFGMEYH